MKKKVLFLCTGNSCRSQMAEGLLRRFYGDRYQVYSAGTQPAGVNPNAVKVMAEIDIDISSHQSKSVTEFENDSFDTVVMVCDRANETCPLFFGNVERIHWSFEDPAEAKGDAETVLAVFRKVRDQIREHIDAKFANNQNN
jgi:arsenate reductase